MSNKNIEEYDRMKLYEPLMPEVIGKVELTDEDLRLAKVMRKDRYDKLLAAGKITQEQYDEMEKDRE